MNINYSYGPVPTVRAFAQSDAFMRGLMGPFGSGKSSGCVLEIVRRAGMQARSPDGVRRSRWCVIRNTFPELRDTTIRTVHQWIPPHLFGEWRSSENEYRVKGIPGCEIEILFRALDRPDHVAHLLSLELTGAWVNEAREVPFSIIEALQGRVGRYPPIRDGGPTWHGVFMDTNPPDSDSKWYKFFEEWLSSEDGLATDAAHRAKYGRPFAEIFKQPSGLAPDAENLANLPNGRGYYETLAAGKDPEWVKVYVAGQYGFVVDGRPVFPEYNDAVHCSDKVVAAKGVPIYRGWDFGLTPACVLVQQNALGQAVVLDEIVSDDMGIDAFGDEVKAHCAKRWSKTAKQDDGKPLGWDPEWIDVGDPAGQSRSQTDEKTCFQVLASKGIFVEPGLQTLAIRLESVRKPLSTMRAGRPGFLMHPRCRALRKGFLGAYQFRRMNTAKEKYTDKPDKNEASHPMDALQYPLTLLFGGGLTTARERPADPFDDMPQDVGADRSATTGY